MTTVIKTKNSTTTSTAPSSLAQGELAVNITDKKLWVGNAATTPVQIAGNGFSPSYGSLTATSITDSGLTSGRVTYATTGGLLTDNANFVFDGTNVGIGTSSPAAKLDVNGSIYAGSAVALSMNSAGSNYGQIGYNTGVGDVYWLGYGSSKTGSSTAVLNWNSSGNLGLGVTPSASTVKTFEIGAVGNGLVNGGTADTYFVAGGYYNAGWKYALTGTAVASYEVGAGNGSHVWKIAGSGTAGNALTWTSAMTLDASGNLYLGSTSSASAARLNVYGLQTFDSPNATVANWYTGGSQIGAFGQGNYAVSGGGATNFGMSAVNSMVFGTGASSTERMRIDSSGNVGIGTSSPSSPLSFASATGQKIRFYNSLSGYGIGVESSEFRFVTDNGAIFTWGTGTYASPTERMRIDTSGNLCIGATSTSVGNGGLALFNSTASVIYAGHQNGTASGASYYNFYYNNSNIGSITQNGTTGVLYNITSDYRLKEVVGEISDSGSRIDAVKPINYTMKTDGSAHRGFLAHEFQAVYPNSVSGEKDAVDEEGNPIYQGMQASSAEALADIFAELQSLRKRVAQLEAK